MKKENLTIQEVYFENTKFINAFKICFQEKAYEIQKLDEINKSQIWKFVSLDEIQNTIRFMIKDENLLLLYELFDVIEEKIEKAIIIFCDFEIFFMQEYANILTKSNKINISPTNRYFIHLDNTKKKINPLDDDKLTINELNVKKLKTYYEWDYIHWGKYSEKKISEIINIDPNYILWCIINLEHFAINGTFFLTKSIRHAPLLLKGLEINEIKKMIIDKWDTSTNSEPEYESYGSWEDSRFYDGFEGDIDTWNHYNQ